MTEGIEGKVAVITGASSGLVKRLRGIWRRTGPSCAWRASPRAAAAARKRSSRLRAAKPLEATRAKHKTGPVLRQMPRSRFTKPAARSGDNGHFAFDALGHHCSS